MSRDYRVIALGLRLEKASAEVLSALKHAEVRAILLKGPLQQSWLEAAGPARASGDIDALVSAEQLDNAGAALEALGYARAVSLPDEPGREHARVWVAAERVPVEVHWSLVGADESKVWEVLSRETETATLLGDEVEIPNEAARCVIVALHAAQHGIGQLAIFHDLEKALVIAGVETWRRAFELAVAMGGSTPFAGALSLTSAGRELLSEFGATAPVLGERQALSLLTPAPTSRGFYFLARQRGALAKTTFLISKLAPSREFMRLRYRLARRNPLGLATAYVLRPFWLARWAPSGLRAWLRARRLAEASRANAGQRNEEFDDER